MVIESRHIDSLEVPDDIFADGLPCESDTPVVILNVGTDPTPEKDQDDAEEPSLVTSEVTGRLPLPSDWLEKAKANQTPDASTPHMTVVKRIMLTFNYKGAQRKAETGGLDSYGPVFLTTHKQLLSWIDEWHGMSLEECRTFETETLARIAGQQPPGDA